MAAPYRFLRQIGNLLKRESYSRRSNVLPLVSTDAVLKLPCSYTQLRYKQLKTRVREAKAQVEKTKDRYIQKKTSTQTENEESQEYFADVPVDNVWLYKHYPPQKYSIEQALTFHKAYAQPAMLDNEAGVVYLNMKLDLSTKKKTKFMNTFRSTIRLPHEFPYGSPPNIIVLCKTEEDLQHSAELGARNYGTPAEIKKLIDNFVLSPKDFDHVLCTMDCVKEVLPLRSHFKDKFPRKEKGNISDNMNEMWELYYYGYTFESIKVTESQGSVQVPIGLVEQPVEHLVENFKTYVTEICNQKSIALGPFITSIKCVAPPSPEEFLLKVEDYVPGYNNEEFDSDEEEAKEALES